MTSTTLIPRCCWLLFAGIAATGCSPTETLEQETETGLYTTTLTTTTTTTTTTTLSTGTSSSTTGVTTSTTTTDTEDTEDTEDTGSTVSPKIYIDAPMDNLEIEVGVSETFRAVVEGIEGGVKYSWDFGDGSYETTTYTEITHDYSDPGIYEVSVMAALADGAILSCISGGDCEITVVANTEPCTSDSDEDCKGRITIEDSMKIEYYRNYALGSANDAIRRAVIIQHGNGRTAEGYFGSAMEAILDEDRVMSTLVLAPRFQLESDGPESDELRWSSTGWKWGHTSHNAPYVSSYGVMDTILEKIADPGKFPNLEEIILYGHSAGGQYFNRYAAGSDAADNADLAAIDIKFVVANPSSFVYLNEYRAEMGKLSTFAVPSAKPADCDSNTEYAEYNEYGYGLDDLNTYMGASTKATIRNRYESRAVVYMAGTDDTDTIDIDSSLDDNCGAILQGDFRLERADIYWNHLNAYYDTSKQSLLYVKGVGHTNWGMLNSPEGKALLFQWPN